MAKINIDRMEGMTGVQILLLENETTYFRIADYEQNLHSLKCSVTKLSALREVSLLLTEDSGYNSCVKDIEQALLRSAQRGVVDGPRRSERMLK